MREFTIGKNDAGQRLDRFVAKNLPLLPPALLLVLPLLLGREALWPCQSAADALTACFVIFSLVFRREP